MLKLSKTKEPKIVVKDNAAIFYFDNKNHDGCIYEPTKDDIEQNKIFEPRLCIHEGDILPTQAIQSIVIDKTFKEYKLCSATKFFEYFTKVETIYGIENLDVSECRTFSNMFKSCQSLKSLDLSSWDFSNAEEIFSMFDSCGNLIEINLSNLNVLNVDNMDYLFNYCVSIETIDLSSWKLEKLRTIKGMFFGCESLKTLNLSCFNDYDCSDLYIDEMTFPINNSIENFICDNKVIIDSFNRQYDISEINPALYRQLNMKMDENAFWTYVNLTSLICAATLKCDKYDYPIVVETLNNLDKYLMKEAVYAHKYWDPIIEQNHQILEYCKRIEKGQINPLHLLYKLCRHLKNLANDSGRFYIAKLCDKSYYALENYVVDEYC